MRVLYRRFYFVAAVLAVVLYVGLVGVAEAKYSPSLNRQNQQFLSRVSAIVNQHNRYIMRQRDVILQIYSRLQQQDNVSTARKNWLQAMAKIYKVRGFSLSSTKTKRQLLSKVNTIPTSLVLAQAVNESSWGRSRFARLANNLFGMWCYRSGCGLVPLRRPKGRSYEVKKYSSLTDSVVAYFFNLNTNKYYRDFRQARQVMVTSGNKLSGLELAKYLVGYSERRHAYVASLQKLIRKYQLYQYNAVYMNS